MTDLLIGGSAWWMPPATLLVMAAVFGLFPGVALRLIVLLYPKDDPRRRELVAELYVLDRMQRIEWVFQQLETALFEGLSSRWARRRERRRREQADDHDTESFEAPPLPDEGHLPIPVWRGRVVPEAGDEAEIVKRRKFLAHAAAVAVGANVYGADSGTWVCDSVLTPAPGHVGMTDVRQVEAATMALRSLDHEYGNGLWHDALAAQLRRGQDMLDSPSTQDVRRRLNIALADLHSLAGWASFTAGLIDSARTHFGRGLELAKAGDSNQLVASILYRMGRVYLHLEAPEDALKMFQLGQIAAQESRSELAVAVLCANQAWAYAMMGHENQTMKLIGRAREELSRADYGRAAAWVRFFNEDDVHVMIGTVQTVVAQQMRRDEETESPPCE